MSWATPPVKLPGEILTAAEINTIGDNLLETAPAKFTTKGDLFVGTGNHAGTRLAVGANGTFPVADSAQTSGIKWQTPFTTIMTRASNKSIATATATAIDFTATNGAAGGDSETYDPSDLHDNVSNQTRIALNRKGIYLIGGYIAFAASAAGTKRYVAISVSGSQVALQSLSVTPANEVVNLSVVTLASLTAANYVELEVYQNSGGNLNCTIATLWLTFLHDYAL